MLAQPQRLRRLAAYVLLVWLFGLGSGIVNACVVRGESSHAAYAVAHDHGGAALVDEAQAPHAAGHDHESVATHLPCQRLCDAPSAAPQSDKQQSSPLSGLWLAAAPVPSFDFQSSAEPRRTVASTHVRWRKTIPVSIAFLRLTL